MPPPVIVDPAQLDVNHVIADLEGIRRVNQQRFEMEQLTAVIHIDPAQHLVIGYKDVRADEFWARGHFPGYPLMPGVLICEAVAQLCSYYITTAKLMDSEFIGFGGLDNVRFRGPVRPGDRLLLVAKATKVHRRQITSVTQAFVGTTMVFHGDVIGVAMNRKEE